MRRGAFGAIASDPHVTQVAQQVLERGGTATDACVASFLVVAACEPGALLGAAVFLVAGPGVGARLFDGSVLQPGIGVRRPRGFREQDAIPEAAAAGVTSSIAAIAAAHAHDGKLSLPLLAKPARAAAVERGARARGELLTRVGSMGPGALREAAFARPFLALVGRAAQGNVTEADLEQVRAQVQKPEEHDGIVWPGGPRLHRCTVAVRTSVACAADARGVMAAMQVIADPDGVQLGEHEVAVPRWAVPVRRGVVRTRPGVRLVFPCPVAILLERGSPWACVAWQGLVAMEPSELAPAQRDRRMLEPALRAAFARMGGASRAFAVVGTGGVRPGLSVLQLPE